MFDCILKNAVVVTPQKAQKLTIAVKNEKIAGLFSPDIKLSAKEEFDFSGKIIFPGVIDSHAHVTFCSDFDTGSYTAASGGKTTPTLCLGVSLTERTFFFLSAIF